MVQSLSLEAAWEKQISHQDRQLVETAFNKIKDDSYNHENFTYLRHDFNHDQALLVVILIHNWSETPMKLMDETLVCFNSEQEEVARYSFSLPFLLSAKTSTPWTLIFPEGTRQVSVNALEELSVQSFTSDSTQV